MKNCPKCNSQNIERIDYRIGVITSEPTIKGGNHINKIDSAFVYLDENIPYKLEVRKVPNYTKKWVDPQLGMRFVKPSRTTDFTEGVITHINVLAKINAGGSIGISQFFPCVFARQTNWSIVNGGDSGSMAFDLQGNVIMQTFAASSTLAIFNPYRSIKEKLNIELDKSETGWIAAASWTRFNNLIITTTASANLRRTPERVLGNVIRILKRGTRLKITGETKVVDSFLWIKVEVL